MNTNERLTSYIHSLESDETPLIREIEREAKETFVPIIRKETASLLKTLIVLRQPKAILEVGTAVGYSALLMSQVMPEDCHITTIEKFEKRIPVARRNFARAGQEERITLLCGDAKDILKDLAEAQPETFDFIFMDAAKGQYIHFLPSVLSLLRRGGVLFSDNILQEGEIIQSRYGVTRRDRTIHSRMREYLYVLKHTETLETSVIPIGDGVALSVKRWEQE